MPSIRELFPNIQKRKRVSRGVPARIGWGTSPTLEEVLRKLPNCYGDSGTIIDSHSIMENSQGTIGEVKRLIIKANNRFGYLCLKISDFPFHSCRSYDELQYMHSNLTHKIKWYDDFRSLVSNRRRCSSREYLTHLNNLTV